MAKKFTLRDLGKTYDGIADLLSHIGDVAGQNGRQDIKKGFYLGGGIARGGAKLANVLHPILSKVSNASYPNVNRGSNGRLTPANGYTWVDPNDPSDFAVKLLK